MSGKRTGGVNLTYTFMSAITSLVEEEESVEHGDLFSFTSWPEFMWAGVRSNLCRDLVNCDAVEH